MARELSCKKKVMNLLKKNGTMYPSDISEKTKYPYRDVLRALKALEKSGLVTKA